MRVFFSAFLFLSLVLPAAAGEDSLKGYWKMTLYNGSEQFPIGLLQFGSKDGKLSIVSSDALKGFVKVKVEDPKVVGDTFTMRVKATIRVRAGLEELVFEYEGKLPKAGAKKIFGSSTQENTSNLPTILESTTATTPFELDRELLLRTPTDLRSLFAIFDLITAAKENKVTAKELQEYVDASLKAADAYGPRFQEQQHLRLLEALNGQKGYGAVAAQTARQVQKHIDPKSPVDAQLQLLVAVQDALQFGGAKEEAAALGARLDKLETQAYAEHEKTALAFKLDKVTPRKGKSNRAVLVELFTGATCPPCVAADLAFDGLGKTYKNVDVVLLQYHLHVPRAEPMTNADSEARNAYYVETFGKQLGATPNCLFNGKPTSQPPGGSKEDAADRYKEFVGITSKLLETPATVQLSGTAVRKGDAIAVNAKVTDLEKPGKKVRLRLALVEDWVRFQGSNGMKYHHRVVRSMIGGARGFALEAKTSEHTGNVELDELRKGLNKFLNDEYPEGSRPMRMRNLHVVAFVQDDETAEILQAIDVPVTEKN